MDSTDTLLIKTSGSPTAAINTEKRYHKKSKKIHLDKTFNFL